MLERLSSFKARSAESSGSSESSASRRAELEGLEGSAQAALARLAEERQVRAQIIQSLHSQLGVIYSGSLHLIITTVNQFMHVMVDLVTLCKSVT